MGTSRAARPSSVLCALALSLLWFVGSAARDPARAQNVVNANFSLPPAANAPNGNGYIPDPPSTPQIGWTFTKTANNTASGVQANGSAFDAPTAPDGQLQTAYIDDLNAISQNINFKLPGDYELSFQIAEYPHGVPSGTTQSVAVFIDGQDYGHYTPQSSTSFNQVPPINFKVATANSSHELKFVGYGAGAGGQLLPGEITAVFIANVAINPVAPQITTSTCPTDIDPTKPVKLSGQSFGNAPGQIQIHFPNSSQTNASQVNFENKPHPKSKVDLYLNVPGQWGDTITSEALDHASPIGAPPPQTVDIYVIGANGKRSSNACHPKFHNTPVITSVSRATITPGQSFNISGWDFGNALGKVTIHFTNNKYPSASTLDSHNDLDAKINKYPNGPNQGEPEWQPSVVNAALSTNFGGVVEQSVDITLTPKGGSASSSVKAQFKPRMVAVLVSGSPMVSVQSCSNGGAANLCDEHNGGSITCFGVNEAASIVFQTETTASVDLPNIPISLYGAHFGCPAGKDSGTDVYQAAVASPWAIASVQYFDAVYQAGWNPTTSGLLSTFTTISVPWETSDDGGGIIYEIVVEAKGPQGVPLQ